MTAADTLSVAKGLNEAQGPQLTGEHVLDVGLTLLATGGPSPELDIVFIHGLKVIPKRLGQKHIRLPLPSMGVEKGEKMHLRRNHYSFLSKSVKQMHFPPPRADRDQLRPTRKPTGQHSS